jgi:hypothetical protein
MMLLVKSFWKSCPVGLSYGIAKFFHVKQGLGYGRALLRRAGAVSVKEQPRQRSYGTARNNKAKISYGIA